MMRAGEIPGLGPEAGLPPTPGESPAGKAPGRAGDLLAAAAAAARAGDLDALRGLVDWPLSGAGQVGRALPGVPESRRAEVTASGLAELDAAASSAEIVEEVLRPLARRLSGAREVRPAGTGEVSKALEVLRVPPAPPGLTDAQRDRLTELRRRAAAVREVYLVADEQGESAVALAADTGRLVLVLADDDDDDKD